jgi:8-oxo-dGTP pyrophosphatase MutT (NUDIX family)
VSAPRVDRALLDELLAGFDRREQPLSGRRAAAVALTVVSAEDGAGLLVTKRSARLRAHPGQWALPGGRIDTGESAEQAALRELDEELNLRLGPDAVVGALDDYATRSGYRISPVVVWAGEAGADPVPNRDEVASVHVVSFGELDVEPTLHSIPESESPVIRLPIRGTQIHAPTAAVLYQFRELVLQRRTTRVDHLEQPVFAWR